MTSVTRRIWWCSFLFLVACSRTEHAPADESVNTSPAAVQPVLAFPNLILRRPIILTHAGDGSGRVFVAEQEGVVHVFPNDDDVEETTVFLDIEQRCVYQDNQNEEGFLGLAFHPRYAENGEFFVYYTTASAPHTSVVSRFRVSKDDPNQADPDSEEELLRIPQPFWNHNGGSIEFGPDGYLYIALGDGGAANDPHGNGQNTQTLLGSVLRIDVDKQEGDKKYGIPSDNPFVGREDEGLPEIWAYGIRNIWRITFDRETGICWAADVGQNLWEEINIVVRGGNHGWNLREGKHRFDINNDGSGSGPRDDLIEPIWEYHHDVGKSITGGYVYRGKQIPQLVGKYVYGDYVSGLLWALDYDFDTKTVRGNHPIPGNIPVASFGEDEDGEIYCMEHRGEVIYRFVSSEQ